MLMLGAAAMINAIDDWVDSRAQQDTIDDLNTRLQQVNSESACRFRVTQPVEDARAQVAAVDSAKLDALSAGLAAFARDDGPGVATAGERIDALGTQSDEAAAQLATALQERADAVITCRSER